MLKESFTCFGSFTAVYCVQKWTKNKLICWKYYMIFIVKRDMKGSLMN